jgi:hypothetical protein
VTANGYLLLRLIGDESTSFFPLEYNNHLISGSMNEYFYRGNEHINGVKYFLTKFLTFLEKLVE